MRLRRVLLSLAALLVPAGGSLAAPPPVSAYAALPAAREARLSPDGSALAMIGVSEGKPAFVIVHLDGSPRRVFLSGGWTPSWIEWKTPKLLVAALLTNWRDRNDKLHAETRLLVLAADGSRVMPVDLTFSGGWQPLLSDRIVSMLPDDPDHVLMASRGGVAVTRVDLRDGSQSEVQDSRSHVYRWYADAQGVIRAGLKFRDDTTTDRRPVVTLMARTSARDDWHDENEDGSRGFGLAAFDPANPDRVLLACEGPAGYQIIRAYSIATGQPGETVAQAPGADVLPISRSHRLIGYETGGVKSSFTYIQPGWAHDAQAVAHALGSGTVEILDRPDDGKHVLAAVHDGAMPLQYWVLDRSGPKTSLHLATASYEDIASDQIGQQRWVSYPARNGMVLPALLTLPPGMSEARSMPFVVLPHGGPGARDFSRFDYMVQFIASRGYGVLQPQFRGSAGFGRALYEGGLHEWGGTMQDDITDATKYLVRQHMADPARIAIVGASFGGYAALEGVAREPALYRGAAALSPVTDLPLFVGGPTAFAQPGMDLLLPGRDYDTLEKASPLHTVGSIQVPVLLVHGRRDFTVPVKQSSAMEYALKRAGKPVEAIYIDGGDHYLERADDRIVWLTALDRFLTANLRKSN